MNIDFIINMYLLTSICTVHSLWCFAEWEKKRKNGEKVWMVLLFAGIMFNVLVISFGAEYLRNYF